MPSTSRRSSRAPSPPALIRGDRELERIFRALYDEPVAALWHDSDAELVARLALLRRKLARERDTAPIGLYSALRHLEDALALSWRGRQMRGVSLEDLAAIAEELEPEERLDDATLARIRAARPARRRRTPA
jgi:hypothetical protein